MFTNITTNPATNPVHSIKKMTKTRIYLTYKDSANNSWEWGGIHITLAGQHNNNNVQERLSHLRGHEAIAIVNNGKHYWTTHAKTPLRLELTKSGYIVYFKSDTLDLIAEKLEDLGFRNIKGPRHSGTDWHITLKGYSKTQSLAYCEILRNSSIRPKWYLTIATEHSDGTHTWEQLKF
jgi:hypothetical protein